MRNANGFGSVYKDKSRPLRKPYKAVVTIGWKLKDDKAVPIRKCIGYFASRKDGLAALLDYQNNGLPEVITFGDAMQKWYDENEDSWSDSTARGYRIQMKKLSPIATRPIRDIRVADLERILDVATATTRPRIRIVMHGAYDWAMRHDYCEKDYSQLIRSYAVQEPKEKVPFSREEIDTLWADGSDLAFSTLVAIYSGWRWNELMTFEVEGDVMVGGSKTDAGKNRKVPIHHRIAPLIDKMYRTPDYRHFVYEFGKLMKKYGMKHTFHDTRHTTATLLYGQDEHLVKLILGHSEKDITKRVYTHNTIEQLRKVIETIV